MIRAIVLASLSVGTLAEGIASCACLGTLPSDVKDVECNYTWAFNGLCVNTVGLVTNWTTYPADYGESCKKHMEPGHSSCFDLTTHPPIEKPPSKAADWCDNKWCYVDPCNCDAADATKSDYFPNQLTYSYTTCGDKNTYTAVESSTNTLGNAECSTEETSYAHSFEMGLGLLLAGMCTLA